jgi:glucose/arabinose dehydrogenase
MSTKSSLNLLSILISVLALTTCEAQEDIKGTEYDQETTVQTAVGELTLPKPYHTKSKVKLSNIKGWDDGQSPQAPAGFTVSRFAEDLQEPRWAYIADDGNIFVAESKKDRITVLRDEDGDGKSEIRETFLEDLNRPFGTLVLNGSFYVANTDGVYRYPYKKGMTQMKADGEKILDLPAGGYNNHWTRNLITNDDGSKIYVTVGSASNVGEHGMEEENRRAAILEINPDGSGEKVYATGLRNPVGVDWNPANGELWTAVNERDKLGDNLVPDYITSVKEGGFYGWPFSYYGQIKDPRWMEDPHPKMVKKAIIPDVSMGSHTASLGLTFYTGNQFPEKYRNGAFVGQHGSWNRSEFAGYKVAFVPFENGEPQPPEDFLTGFIQDGEGRGVHGRPVGVHQMPDGSLLVMDDEAGIIWQVSAE